MWRIDYSSVVGIVFVFLLVHYCDGKKIVINTWSGVFEGATFAAFETLNSTSSSSPSSSAIDAIESGCRYCEEHQCDTSVGYGNHPDTTGHTSLDAMIMNGNTFDIGAVGYIKKYRNVISIARKVMDYTDHTMLVGEGAEEFANMMGFVEQSATTDQSVQIYEDWKKEDCQPNFYANIPEAKYQCGPYSPPTAMTDDATKPSSPTWQANKDNHDTIGIVTMDDSGLLACGTSTNGANHKVAGRIGDSPIPGSGCYVDSKIGGAAATGDGDVMMRFSPSSYAVSLMELKYSPKEACQLALNRIAKVFPTFSGGMVCLNKDGDFGGASINMNFSYSYMLDGMTDVGVVTIN